MESTQDVPAPTTHLQRLERIAELKETVQSLQDRTEQLEAERKALLEENRKLRRRLTHSQLVDNLLVTLEENGAPSTERPDPSPTAGRLYRTLPSSFSFPVFFQTAEEEGLEPGAARRCLRHLLSRSLLVQEGAQLSKPEHSEDAGTGEPA